MNYQNHKEDCLLYMKSMKDKSVDLIVTDPAYESLEKHRKVGTTTRLTNEWFEIFPNERFEEFFTEAYRVLKNNSHMYVFCDQETMFVIKPLAEKVGFKFWKPLVWDKVSIGMGYHFRARYEFILFFEKGKRRLKNLGTADVLTCKKVRTDYPTEKPIPVLTTLIEQSSDTGQVVFDPFMGSGSTGEAAIRLEREFIGCDIAEKSQSSFLERIKGIKNGEKENSIP